MAARKGALIKADDKNLCLQNFEKRFILTREQIVWIQTSGSGGSVLFIKSTSSMFRAISVKNMHRKSRYTASPSTTATFPCWSRLRNVI